MSEGGELRHEFPAYSITLLSWERADRAIALRSGDPPTADADPDSEGQHQSGDDQHQTLDVEGRQRPTPPSSAASSSEAAAETRARPRRAASCRRSKSGRPRALAGWWARRTRQPRRHRSGCCPSARSRRPGCSESSLRRVVVVVLEHDPHGALRNLAVQVERPGAGSVSSFVIRTTLFGMFVEAVLEPGRLVGVCPVGCVPGPANWVVHVSWFWNQR